MGKKRRTFSAEFKAKVAIATLNGAKPIKQIATDFGVHPNQVTNWRKQLLKASTDVFLGKHKPPEEELEKERDDLHRQIGQMKVEVDWLRKKIRGVRFDLTLKCEMIEAEFPDLSVVRQCELLELSRSSYYRKSKREGAEGDKR